MQSMLIRQLLKGNPLIFLNHIPGNRNDLKAAAGCFTKKNVKTLIFASNVWFSKIVEEILMFYTY